MVQGKIPPHLAEVRIPSALLKQYVRVCSIDCYRQIKKKKYSCFLISLGMFVLFFQFFGFSTYILYNLAFNECRLRKTKFKWIINISLRTYQIMRISCHNKLHHFREPMADLIRSCRASFTKRIFVKSTLWQWPIFTRNKTKQYEAKTFRD